MKRLAAAVALLAFALPAFGQNVNSVQIVPQASGTPAAIEATGKDASISINLKPKGSGTVQVGGTALPSGTVPSIITGTASETPGALSAGCADQSSTITLTGAAVGDACMVGTPAAGAGVGVEASCYISASNTATVRLCTMTGTPTGTTGTYRATVVH